MVSSDQRGLKISAIAFLRNIVFGVLNVEGGVALISRKTRPQEQNRERRPRLQFLQSALIDKIQADIDMLD